MPRVAKPRHDDLTAPHYGYIYNEAAEVVPVGADVTFDSNATMVGISFYAGHLAGHHRRRRDLPGAIRHLGHRGEPVRTLPQRHGDPGKRVRHGRDRRRDRRARRRRRATVRNHTSAGAVTLQTLAGGTQTNVNASLMIERLPDAPG